MGEKGEPQFVADEIEDGFKVEWYPLNEAIKVVQSGSLSDYQAKFIIERELLFLNEAKKYG